MACLALGMGLGTTPLSAQGLPVYGWWDTPFTHGLVGSGCPPYTGQPFNAIHMALIPGNGPHAGKVFVMEDSTPPASGATPPVPVPANVAYAVINCQTKTVDVTGCLTMPGVNCLQNNGPTGPFVGDIFCAGAGWTMHGTLLFCGGVLWHKDSDPSHQNYDPNWPKLFDGCNLTYIWDPSTNTWYQQAGLHQARYYPTVTQLGANVHAVTGGATTRVVNTILTPNTYEVFVVGAGGLTGSWQQWKTSVPPKPDDYIYTGPGLNPTGTPPQIQYTKAHFYWYPHIFLTSEGYMFNAFFAADGSRALHQVGSQDPGWDYNYGRYGIPTTNPVYVHYGSSVLLAIDENNLNSTKDRVLRLGGVFGNYQLPFGGTGNASYFVEQCRVATNVPAPSKQWTIPPLGAGVGNNLMVERFAPNAVHLPDGSILVIGGSTEFTTTGSPNPADNYTAEIITESGAHLFAGTCTPRSYHSTAALLPDARVITGGGNTRTTDYQIYNPPYLAFPNKRPTFVSGPTTMTIGTTTPLPISYAIPEVETGESNAYVSRVVLIRPASVTHNFDMDQRVVILKQQVPNNGPYPTISVIPPSSSNIAPMGWWMMFLVSNEGIPSIATWVKVQ